MRESLSEIEKQIELVNTGEQTTLNLTHAESGRRVLVNFDRVGAVLEGDHRSQWHALRDRGFEDYLPAAGPPTQEYVRRAIERIEQAQNLVGLKLWLDDLRPPPDDTWWWVMTVEQAIAVMKTGEVAQASIDHDLGQDEQGQPLPEGGTPLTWMAENNIWPSGSIAVHSASNPAGVDYMLRVIPGADRSCGRGTRPDSSGLTPNLTGNFTRADFRQVATR